MFNGGTNQMKFTRTLVAAATVATLMGAALMTAHAHGRYGGSSYSGKPALAVTASLVQAGGGAAKFSSATALTAMVGSKLTNAEIAKLTRQYGKAKVASFVQVGDFAVKDALAIATKAGVKLPKATLRGKQLASTLVQAGLEKDSTFNVELLLDKAVTHKIHEQVMDDIDKKFGASADANYHKMANQAYYDVAHALGAKSVKLNKYH
jgi:hypothetical protein